MINFYDHVLQHHQSAKHTSFKDLVFLNYGSPIMNSSSGASSNNCFCYIISGKKIIHTADATTILHKGEFAFVKKATRILDEKIEDPFCMVMFIITDGFITQFLRDYTLTPSATIEQTPSVMRLTNDLNIHRFYKCIIPYLASGGQIPEEILELKFKELLLHVLRSPANRNLYEYFLMLTNDTVSSITQIMEANYPYNLTIEAFAKMTHRSVSSFKRDFMNIYKTSPGKWLMQRRLEHAKALLISSDQTVASIAYQSGFENIAHFTRVFKHKTGYTPLEFRKKS